MSTNVIRGGTGNKSWAVRVLLISGLFWVSCDTSSELPALAYAESVESKSGNLRQEKQIGKMVFEVLYKPLDYVVMLEQPSGNDSLRQRLRSEYAAMQYFTFRIRCPEWKDELLKYGIADYTDYTQRLAYCMSGLQEDLSLEEGGKVRPCRLFHFERVHQLDAGLTFLAGFDRDPSEQEAELRGDPYEYGDKTIIYNDRLFGSGSVKLTIRGSSLTRQPRLKTTKE